MKNKVVIIGISSDIGQFLADKFFKENYEIVGTYNSKKSLKFISKYKVIKLDMKKIKKNDVVNLKKISKNWKIFISCVGSLKPIGKIFDNNISKIKENFNINFFSNLEVLKNIINLAKNNGHIFFFSGSGSNGPSPELSSYCLSKILLIKTSELISEEYPKISCTTIGPGFINTKIHRDLISRKKKYKLAYKKYVDLKNKSKSKSMKVYNDIHSLIDTCIRNPSISNGRNFSSKYDDWKNNFSKNYLKLKKNKDLFKLRRFV